MSAKSKLSFFLAGLFLGLKLCSLKDFHDAFSFSPGPAFWEDIHATAVAATAAVFAHDDDHGDFGRTARAPQSTTCLERRGNRTLLRIDTARQGGFPETQFTHYLRTGLIARFNATTMDELCQHGTFYIHQNSSRSNVEVEVFNGGSTEFRRILRDRVFSADCGRRLPTPPDGGTATAVFGLVGGDYTDPDKHRFQCFGKGSTAGGVFSLYNFQHVRAMIKHPDEVDYQYANLTVPWEDRGTVPIWRGGLRGGEDYVGRVLEAGANGTVLELLDRFFVNVSPANEDKKPKRDNKPQNRIALLKLSLRHPELLDASGEATPKLRKKIIFNNRTVEEFFPPADFIPKEEYYSKYQVYIVMGGIGAAFRTADHLAMGAAVIVQDWPYEEWFLSYMRPGVDYIPLKADLSDLNTTLRWVRDHPAQVRRIAANGRAFYERYLAYENVEEFLYELVYRLAEARAYEEVGLNLLPGFPHHP